MSVGIVFFFEENDVDVWSGRNVDLDAWNYNCKIADIKKAIIVNKTEQDIQTFDVDMDIQIVTSLPLLTGHTTQIVCPWENTPTQKTNLWEFDHNTDWYVFGPSSGWANNYFGDSYLTIPQNGLGAHHSVFVATSIMFHKYNIKGS